MKNITVEDKWPEEKNWVKVNCLFLNPFLVQRRNLKRRLFKEINAPTEHTPGNALKWKTIY
jgi:hypothetical protein